MKSDKLTFIIDTIIKLGVIVALYIAATTRQQYGYYNFIRWLVMVSFVYFAYQSFKKKQIGLLIFFIGAAILFNPFHKFWFQRDSWHTIDFIVADITAVTIIVDWGYKKAVS